MSPGAKTNQEPLLDADDIQGNVLAGFNKDHQLLMAVKIQDVTAARRWLSRVVPWISSTADVHSFNTLFRRLRARLGTDPCGLVATWANIAFSREGLSALISPADVAQVPDAAFQAGMPARSGILGDPLAKGQTDPAASWIVGGTGQVPDLLVIVASDDPCHLNAFASRLRPGAADGPAEPQVVWEELGATRSDQRGHEHFGFKDGLSQPGIRGLLSRRPDVYLTQRMLAPSPPGEVDFAAPGQPLVWPGQFVFGYPSQDRSTGNPLAVPQGPAWLKNGSLLVFRRLEQKVAAFHGFIRSQADLLAQDPRFTGMTAEQLGALLVGRWASGAPVSRSPAADRPDLAADSLANNDFVFTTATPTPRFLHGPATSPQQFPAALADIQGIVCPHAAHIRKMNPRDQSTDLGDRFDTLTRRVLRRGIPFGPSPADPLVDDGVKRGLHFLCYQTSIVNQFEALQADWANSASNPQQGGSDLIIGQVGNPLRTLDLLEKGGGSSWKLRASDAWVVPTGGGYFFVPSIRVIRDLLSA